MSACGTCGGNPCRCCEHDRIEEECPECAHVRAFALEERVKALEDELAALKENFILLDLLRNSSSNP